MTTDLNEHRRRWDDDLAAYALHALDEREAARVEGHLRECEACTERISWLAPAVDILPATVPQEIPPPELRVRLMEVVEGEADDAASPVRARRRIPMPVFGSFALRPALAGFGVALLLVAGVAGYALRDGTSTSTETFTAHPTDETSLASGTLEVDGDEGTLLVANLPAPPRDEVYQAWVQHKGSDGGIVPSSVFVVHDDGSGAVAIPEGLDGAARVLVTREPEGGSKKPTEGALLTAELE